MSKSPELDAKELHQYLESGKEIEKKITKRIANLNNSDLQLIKIYYKNFFLKDLIEDEFKQKLKDDYLDFILALFENPVDYNVEELNKVFSNTTNDNKYLEILIEIIAPKPKWVLDKIKEAYYKKYAQKLEKKLEEFLKNELVIFNFLKSILNSERNKNDEPKEEKCLEIVKKIKDMNVDVLNTDNHILYEVLSTNSPQEISTIARKYFEETQETFLDFMTKNCPEQIKSLLKSILFAIISPSEYFARKIHDAITTELIDKDTLIRVIVSRYELDIQYIKNYYKQIYQVELIKDAEKLNENFKHLLVGLIGDS